MFVSVGFALILALVVVFVAMVLMATADRFRSTKLYLAWLDIISFGLTGLTLIVGLVATHQELTAVFFAEFGDLELNTTDERDDLRIAVMVFCPIEEDCAAVRFEATKTLGRGSHPAEVKIDPGIPLPVAKAAVAYNRAIQERNAGQRHLLANPLVWISAALMCGFLIGFWRRYLVLRQEISAGSAPG